jgi:Mg-chelatase subunit ChlD
MNLNSNLSGKQYLVYVFSFLCLTSVYSQNKALKLSMNTVDFGRIAAIVYPAKIIEFTNNSDQNLAILLIEKGPNVKVNFERRFFQPGEKGIISVFYEVRDVGEFNEDMKIFTNLDNDPQMVKLKGLCISIQECFPNIHNLNLRNIMVINKTTQAPIPLATLTFIRNQNANNPVNLSMDKNGKAIEELPIGLYNVSGNINGYEPYAGEFFLPKTQPNVIIELTPKKIAREKAPIRITPSTVDAKTPSITSTELPEDKYAANNIVLLLDVSSSMRGQGKFTLLQQSINNLVMILRSIDYVSIITYASEAKVALPGLPGNEKEKITTIVQELIPIGTTQGVRGLNMAYDMATKRFIQSGNNQIILATDGEFSEKGLTDEYYQKFISGYAEKGIKLSILGFGVNQFAIDRMKKMATSGTGTFILVSSEKFAKTVLIDEVKSMSFMNEKK